MSSSSTWVSVSKIDHDIGPHKFLNPLLYRYSRTIQSVSFLDHVKLFILESGSIIDQGTTDPPSSLYKPPHSKPSIYYPNPSTFYDHFITNMVFVDISPSEDWSIIVATSGYEFSICVEYCLCYLWKKLRVTWIPLGDKKSPNFLPIFLWSYNYLSKR